MSCLLFAFFAAADPTTVEQLAPHAAGVALLEVRSVTEEDSRPSDGSLAEIIKFKPVRASGAIPKQIYIVKEHGGLAPPGVNRNPPKHVLPPGELKKGKRYWVAFASNHQWEKYPEGVIGYWPGKDEKAAKLLGDAVKEDVYKWHPQFHPKTGLTYGRLVDDKEKKWQVRVIKAGKVLWEATLMGTPPTEEYMTWGMWDNWTEGFPSKMPESGHVLIADTLRPLGAKNEFDLKAGKYGVGTAFDPETGKRVAAWVYPNPWPPDHILNRDYEPKTGQLRQEARFDWPETGGKTVGADTDKWYRKTVRTFDSTTGKVTKTQVFRYDDGQGAGARWVPVSTTDPT